jgi:hypothetical protein
MAEAGVPRTRLAQVLRQRHLTIDQFRKDYLRVSGTELSERQAYRWVAGEVAGAPYPHAQAALERMFGEPVARLFGAPYGAVVTAGTRQVDLTVPDRGCARTDWEGQVISMSADRARDFLTRAEASNVGRETIDQLTDDIRRLVVSYQQKPLGGLLGEMAEAQDRAFTLLEGRQKPELARDLYLLAGIASGLMAKASHDFGTSHDALTQARAAYACADNAGHAGLRAWIRALQALITYWAGRFEDSIRYARMGADAAEKGRGTATIWLASGEARSLAAVGRYDEAHAAMTRASEARDGLLPDELDQLGGLCTFSRPRQLYYAADALAWGGPADAHNTERVATEALEAYGTAPADDRAFGDESGTRCDLALARIYQGEIDGAAEALAPVLDLSTDQRIHGIMVSVERVRVALGSIESPNRKALEMHDAVKTFTVDRLALPR